jgi:hypothetical protein
MTAIWKPPLESESRMRTKCPQPTIDRGKKTVEKRVLHWHQLYEQQKQKKATSEEMASILDCYVNRWQRWVAAGLQGIKLGGVYEQIRYQQFLMQIGQ